MNELCYLTMLYMLPYWIVFAKKQIKNKNVYIYDGLYTSITQENTCMISSLRN